MRMRACDRNPPVTASPCQPPFARGPVEKTGGSSEKSPLAKGGRATKWRGDSMRRKHNPKLTGRAKELRKNMTPEERKLWYDYLRTYPIRFLRQKIIDGYIVDFYCTSAKIAVELDGSQHNSAEGREYDAVRDKILNAWDIQVLRVPNRVIHDEFEAVCRQIDHTVKHRLEISDRK